MDNGKSCVDFRIPQLPVTLNDLDLTRVDCVSGGAICVQQLVYTVVDVVGPCRGNITNRVARTNKHGANSIPFQPIGRSIISVLTDWLLQSFGSTRPTDRVAQDASSTFDERHTADGQPNCRLPVPAVKCRRRALATMAAPGQGPQGPFGTIGSDVIIWRSHFYTPYGIPERKLARPTD